MRILLLVGPDESDLFFANSIAEKIEPVGIIVESQRDEPDESPLIFRALKYARHPRVFIAKVYDYLIGRHLHQRADYKLPENRVDFGIKGKKIVADGSIPVRHTSGYKKINDAENVEWIRNCQPDVIAVCGASVLKSEILRIPALGVLNLHGGLAQKYRGLFTTEWAIYNEEPEYVGATVHYVAAGIDDGKIIYQSRPNIERSDNPHSLYMKIVTMGVSMMLQALRDIEAGSVVATVLNEKGDLYLESAFTRKVQLNTWRKVRSGVINRYLVNKKERDAKVLSGLINEYRPS